MANFFEWDTTFNLGLPAMDDEHIQIVNCMNRLHELHETGTTGTRLTNSMAELLRVTRGHFADEEAYMAKVNYPGLGKHRHMHAHLLDRLGQFDQEMQKTGAASADLFAFLKMWLKAHICGIDTQYVKFSQVA
jgi:hemerythrin